MKKKFLPPKWWLVVFIFICNTTWAQRDTEFWFAAPDISSDVNWTVPLDTPIYLRITAYDLSADVTISAPAIGATFTTKVVHVNANSTRSINLSSEKNKIEVTPSDAILNKGLHIQSTNPISVYYELANPQNSEIWTLKGRNALGKSFFIPAQTFLDNWTGASPDAYSTFDIVATEDNTLISIQPKNPIFGHTVSPYNFSVTLNKGETYSNKNISQSSTTKLDGSIVTSNKPIAITSTDDLMNSSWGNAYDAGGDQIIPINKIGTEYIAVHGGLSNETGDTTKTIHPEKLFVLTTQDNTKIRQDGGSWITIPNKGTTHQYDLTLYNLSSYIDADKPVYVSQLSGLNAEPGWDVLPPITCNGSTEVAYTRTQDGTLYFLLSTKGGQNTFSYTVDDNGIITHPIISTIFKPVPGAPLGWAACRVKIDLTTLPVGASIIIKNTTRFNMGVNNGKLGQTGLFGYFSNFGSFNIPPTSNGPLCIGDTLKLFADSLKDAHYHWAGPNGFTSDIQYPVIYPFTALNEGIYVLTVSDSFCTSVDSVIVKSKLCTNPCDSLHAVFTFSDSVICNGDSTHAFINGGPIFKFIINGIEDIADDGTKYNELPTGGYAFNPLIKASDKLVLGLNTVCLVVYSANPDSTTDFCSDTACATFTIINCCNNFHAVYTSVDTSYCLGSSDSVYYGGGKYGKFYYYLNNTFIGEDPIIETNGIVSNLYNFSGSDIPPVDTPIRICFVAYSDNPDSTTFFCSDTICKDLVIRRCRCENLTPEMSKVFNGDGSYTFSSIGSPVPTVLTWIIDGDTISQTAGDQPFVYKDVKIGKHNICMEAAYITPIGNGLSQCCYVTVCDTLDYDNCDVWRATDSVSYTLDPNNINHVSFTYHGTTPTSTQWNFGDGSPIFVQNGNVDHTYTKDGKYTVCAYIVWSVDGIPNCCCLDTICFDVDVSVCQLGNVHIEPADTTVDGYRYKLIWDNTTSIQYSTWYGAVTGTGTTSDLLQPNYSGAFDICAGVKYSVFYQGKNTGCDKEICSTYNLTGKNPKSGMRFYPNPAKTSITVEIINYTEEHAAKLSIVDMTGQIMDEREINNLKQGANPIYINIEKLQKGVYQLNFKLGGSVHQVEKLIKE